MLTEKQLRNYKEVAKEESFRPSKRFDVMYRSVSDSSYKIAHDFKPFNVT
jgi:hypothetical protein